jgi:small subunit ribosomal protein S13
MSESFRHIIRICGTDIDGTKKLAFGLSKIRGIGINYARSAVKAVNLDPETRIGSLTDEDVQKIEDAVNNPEKYGLPPFTYNRRKDFESGSNLHLLGPELALRQKMDIELLKDIKCWRGVRHSFGLKVRGQRTRTTGRTGKTVGVRKKAILAAAAAAATAERKKEKGKEK